MAILVEGKPSLILHLIRRALTKPSASAIGTESAHGSRQKPSQTCFVFSSPTSPSAFLMGKYGSAVFQSASAPYPVGELVDYLITGHHGGESKGPFIVQVTKIFMMYRQRERDLVSKSSESAGE